MNGKLVITLDTDGCKGTPNYVRYLEHVQARITLTADRRGEVVIYLTSPSNTRSTLLARRERDYSREGFNNWAFMTTHNWGEEAEGRWFLQIENGASSCEFYDQISVLVCRAYLTLGFFFSISFYSYRYIQIGETQIFSFLIVLICCGMKYIPLHFVINIWFVNEFASV